MENALRYCYACRAYHDIEEGRCAWAWVKWTFAGLAKAIWYSGMILGNTVGAVVLIGWSALFLGLAYYFVAWIFQGFKLN